MPSVFPTTYSFKHQKQITLTTHAQLHALLAERRARGTHEDTIALLQRHFESVLQGEGG